MIKENCFLVLATYSKCLPISVCSSIVSDPQFFSHVCYRGKCDIDYRTVIDSNYGKLCVAGWWMVTHSVILLPKGCYWQSKETISRVDFFVYTIDDDIVVCFDMHRFFLKACPNLKGREKSGILYVSVFYRRITNFIADVSHLFKLRDKLYLMNLFRSHMKVEYLPVRVIKWVCDCHSC